LELTTTTDSKTPLKQYNNQSSHSSNFVNLFSLNLVEDRQRRVVKLWEVEMIAQLPIMGVLAPDVGPKLLQGARHVTSILWQVLTTTSGLDQVLVGKVETAVARVAPGTIQDMESHLLQAHQAQAHDVVGRVRVEADVAQLIITN
jgi:hypothetical protein